MPQRNKIDVPISNVSSMCRSDEPACKKRQKIEYVEEEGKFASMCQSFRTFYVKNRGGLCLI